jgi:hypothetical protein
MRAAGDDVRSSVRRMISALLIPAMQVRFNRTGIKGKFRFSEYLEPLLKGKVVY